MKILITRTDVVEVEAAPDTPLAQASAAVQLAAFRASVTKSIFDDAIGQTFDTSDGEWTYTYVDHVAVQVGFVPEQPPIPKDQEP